MGYNPYKYWTGYVSHDIADPNNWLWGEVPVTGDSVIVHAEYCQRELYGSLESLGILTELIIDFRDYQGISPLEAHRVGRRADGTVDPLIANCVDVKVWGTSNYLEDPADTIVGGAYANECFIDLLGQDPSVGVEIVLCDSTSRVTFSGLCQHITITETANGGLLTAQDGRVRYRNADGAGRSSSDTIWNGVNERIRVFTLGDERLEQKTSVIFEMTENVVMPVSDDPSVGPNIELGNLNPPSSGHAFRDNRLVYFRVQDMSGSGIKLTNSIRLFIEDSQRVGLTSESSPSQLDLADYKSLKQTEPVLIGALMHSANFGDPEESGVITLSTGATIDYLGIRSLACPFKVVGTNIPTTIRGGLLEVGYIAWGSLDGVLLEFDILDVVSDQFTIVNWDSDSSSEEDFTHGVEMRSQPASWLYPIAPLVPLNSYVKVVLE